MATVITNLLSAIPWIGPDFVEFVKLLLFIITRPYYYFLNKCNNNMSTIGKVNESAFFFNKKKIKSRTDQENKLFYILFLTNL